MQIYLARNNQQAGPYTLDQLNQMLASQQVLLTDLVWHQGMTEWKALGELTQGKFIYQPEGFTPPFGTVPTTQNTPVHPSTDTTQSPSKNNARLVLASIVSRFFAKVIDLLLWIPAFMIMSLFFKADQIPKLVELQQQMQSATTADQASQLQHQVFQLIPMEAWQAAGLYIFIMLIVQAIMVVKSGQSIGKRLLKIQIVDIESQQPTTLFRAFTLRSIVFIFLNVLLFPFITFFDFIFAVGKKRQTLHDKLAKTIVVKK